MDPEDLREVIGAYHRCVAETVRRFEGLMRSSARALQEDDSGHRDKTNDDMLDMADNLVADQMAGRRAFGIADAILRQLLPAAGPAPAPDGAALPLHPTAAPMPISDGQRKVLPDTKSSSSI